MVPNIDANTDGSDRFFKIKLVKEGGEEFAHYHEYRLLGVKPWLVVKYVTMDGRELTSSTLSAGVGDAYEIEPAKKTHPALVGYVFNSADGELQGKLTVRPQTLVLKYTKLEPTGAPTEEPTAEPTEKPTAKPTQTPEEKDDDVAKTGDSTNIWLYAVLASAALIFGTALAVIRKRQAN